MVDATVTAATEPAAANGRETNPIPEQRCFKTKKQETIFIFCFHVVSTIFPFTEINFYVLASNILFNNENLLILELCWIQKEIF